MNSSDELITEMQEILSAVLNPNNGAVTHIPSWLEVKIRVALSKARKHGDAP